MDTNLKKHIVYAVIAVLFFGLGYWAYMQYDATPIVQENPAPQEMVNNDGGNDRNPPESSDGTPGQNVSQNIITYTDSGFEPKSLTVKKGTVVTYKNNSAKSMWPASARHPDHVLYSGAPLSEHCPDANNDAFDACAAVPAGGSWTFTFNKTGTWNYHDHLAPTFFGSVVVTD